MNGSVARTVAAIDLGAESGRVTAVSFDGTTLDVHLVNRFQHEPSRFDGLLRWDINGLWASIGDGLGRLDAGQVPISSVGVDTWGVDYGLIDATGHWSTARSPIATTATSPPCR